MKREFHTASESETIKVAREFASGLEHGDVVALYGDLGAGKTQFVKGVCDAFKVHSHVSSPTFVILNRYEGKDRSNNEVLIHHFDLYRVRSVEEVYDLGYEEFFASDGICLIEWADYLGALLPERRYDVRLALGDQENLRAITIESRNVGEKKQSVYMTREL